jgi:hypothetical protein
VILDRVFARQLLSYDTVDVTGTSGASWNKSIALVPDVATVVPSKANGGISSNGLVYTYHLRSSGQAVGAGGQPGDEGRGRHSAR